MVVLFYIVYNIALIILFVVLLPYFLHYIITNRDEWLERIGFIKPIKDEVIWIHAASVGEINGASSLIREFKKNRKDSKILLTTMTKTGKTKAKLLNPPPDFVFYLPLDIPLFVSNFIMRIRPKALILTESEMWVNLVLFTRTKTRHIILANGRFSERTFKIAYPFRKFICGYLEKFEAFLMRTDDDRKRLLMMGVDINKVEIVGELKFSVEYTAETIENFDKPKWLKILVAGCTHRGEEESIIGIFEELAKDFPGLRLIIAPRHPERFGEVADLLEKRNAKFSRFSVDGLSIRKPVLLLDVMGNLTLAYSIGDIAFIGGTLVNIGGHNPLEPSYFGLPVLAGPYIKNAKDTFELLRSNGALFIVNSAQELKEKLRELLSNDDLRLSAGRSAKEVVRAGARIAKNYFERIAKIVYENTS